MESRIRILFSISVILLTAMTIHGQSRENMPDMPESMPGMAPMPDKNNSAPITSEPAAQSNKPKPVDKIEQNTEKADSTFKSQKTCPIMGGPIDKEIFVDYKDFRIYVCCERCISLVKKQPENALQQLRNMGQRAEIRRSRVKKNAPMSKKADSSITQSAQFKKPSDSIHQSVAMQPMVMDSSMNMEKKNPSDEKELNNEKQIYKPHTVIYRLSISDTTVDYTGKKKRALAINGSIPGPTLTFTEGDTAEIYIHNSLKTETSIHWHGLIVPNQYDGVPFLTTAPIEPGKIRVFKFPIVQSGTYWYHSHTGLQEQLGMYGALIIHKRNKIPTNEHVLLLSDWTDENPYNIYRNLTMGSDWYAIKRGSTQSFGEAISEGHFGTKLINTFKRMTSMDVSDVYYDKALANGKPQYGIPNVKTKDKVTLRIINGGASSYFWINYAGGPITVVATDGADIVPVNVDRLIIGVAETYDIIVTVPDSKSYELMATSEDRTISSSVWLGTGPKVSLKPLQRLKYFEGMKAMNSMMKLNGRMDNKGMKSSLQQMDMNRVMYPELTDNTESGNADSSLRKAQDSTNPSSILQDTSVNRESNNLSMVGMNMTERAEAGSMPGMEMNSNHKDNSAEDQNTDSMAGMDMSGSQSANKNMSNMPGMEKDTKKGIRTLNYTMLRSKVKTTLPDAPLHTLEFRLSGNMSRYVWTINNKKVSERDKILIRKGENIRIILHNGTMMRHPMHLHGHFFRVLNGQGDYAPLKTVLDILPMETDTIEFAGSEEGDWSFHCHILYHMMSGMGTVLSYENSPANPEFTNPEQAYKKFLSEDKAIHFMAQTGLEHNGSMGEIALGTTRYSLQEEWRVGIWSNFSVENETHFGRYLGEKQWWFPYIGTDWRYDKTAQPEENLFKQSFLNKNRIVACAGLQYLAPFLVLVDVRVDHEGIFRVQLRQSDLPLTSRLRLNWLVNTNKEYTVNLSYILTQFLSLTTHYDSDMKWGAGIWLRY